MSNSNVSLKNLSIDKVSGQGYALSDQNLALFSIRGCESGVDSLFLMENINFKDMFFLRGVEILNSSLGFL